MLKDYLASSKAWPVEEAKKILKRIGNKTPEKGYVLLETGYGPSGLPHIGTFGEVARTSMVKFAFEELSGIPAKIIAFSDDMDGLRKVPDNVPNKKLLEENLNKPLTKVPDPFGKFNSFGEHNNAKLQEFLDSFGFSYEFYSATKCYTSGMFDEVLLKILQNYEAIKNVVLPTLGEERKETYSPFLPICAKTGKVLQAKVIDINVKKGTITYINEDNEEVETLVTKGNCKLQWKVDWAMRWYALGVDYEMYGKDLIPTFELSSKICKILKGRAPENLAYELFLDEKGQKISKSKGNGLSIEDWLRYGNQESLSLFMYNKPKTAKRLYFDVIPKNIDEWLQHNKSYKALDDKAKVNSPIFFIHKNNPPVLDDYIGYGLILNLVGVIQASSKDKVWFFLDKYKKLEGNDRKIVNSLLDYAINYYNDFVKPFLNYKVPNNDEKKLLLELESELQKLTDDSTAEQIQTIVYGIGKNNNLELKSWFLLLYQTLLGQNEGPRMGSFFKLLGIKDSIALIQNAINRN